MKSILAAFAKNTVFANIVLLLIFVAGYFATTHMIRETYPEFSLDIITIAVPYPGADPEEVEEGISRKIEEAIEGLEGTRQYTTHSYEELCTAYIEVRQDYDVDEVLDRVRTQVDTISTYPVYAEKPIISKLSAPPWTATRPMPARFRGSHGQLFSAVKAAPFRPISGSSG